MSLFQSKMFIAWAPLRMEQKPEGHFGREQSQASQLYQSDNLDPDHLGPTRLDKIRLRR